MNALRIASNARDRGDYVRAVIVLAQALKRSRDVDGDAFEMLIETYANLCMAPGLEREVCDIIAMHKDAGYISGEILVCLEERDMLTMARTFRRDMEARGVVIELPPPAPAEPETQEQERAPQEFLPEDEYTQPESAGEVIDEASTTTEIPRVPRGLEVLEARARAALEARQEQGGEPPGEQPLAEPEGEDFVTQELDPGEQALDPTLEQDPEPDERAEEVPSGEDAPSGLVAEVTAPAETALASDEPLEQVKSGGKWRGRLVALVAGVAILGALVGLIGWMSSARSARVQAIDQQLEMFDPLHPEGFEAALMSAQEEGEDIGARADFVRALLALERGEQSAPLEALGEDAGEDEVWAYGARAMAAMQGGDFEQALMHAVTMERVHPGELPTLWVRARLEESRGEFGAAADAYARALEQHPRFVPGVVGQLRVAYRVVDQKMLKQAGERLRTLNPIHPYLKLSERAPLTLERDYMELLAQPVAATPVAAEAATPDHFLRALNYYHGAQRAWRRGDLAQARESVDEALLRDPHLAAARMLHGVLRVVEGRHEAASVIFAELARAPGMTVEARLMVMRVAPALFARAGRADLALIFALDVPGDASHARARDALGKPERARYDSLRAVALSLTREQLEGSRELAAAAALTSAQTLWELGDAPGCLSMLAAMETAGPLSVDARLLRLLALFILGDRQRLADALYQVRGEPEEQIAQTIMHMLEGDWDRAAQTGAMPGERMTQHPFWLRVRALAMLARDRPEDVLMQLDTLQLSSAHRDTVDRLRLRAWSKMRQKDRRIDELAARVDPATLTSVHALVDLGASAFWRGNVEQAKGLMERALARAPSHPEANWFMAMLLLQSEKKRAASKHLELASIPSDEDPRVLLELGQFYLALGRNMQAQKMFYKVVLQDRKNLRAIEGLGQSYVGWDREVGKRDLARILISYEQQNGTRAQAAEVLRWLAILHGSRRGRPEGLAFLQRAIGLAGPLGQLLLELAHYQERAGQPAQAQKTYVRALRQDSTLPGAHIGLARHALRSKDERAARDHLVKYLELDPYGEDVDWAREKLQAIVEKKAP